MIGLGLVAGGLSLGNAVAGFFGGKSRARDERNRMESERRQRVKRNTAQINNSSSTGVGSVDINSVDQSYLENADMPDANFVQDPSFFGTVLTGFGNAVYNYNAFKPSSNNSNPV